MKRIAKDIYMFIFHPLIFFRIPLKKKLFIKRKSNIKSFHKIVFEDNVTIGYDVRINFFDNNNEKKLFFGKNVYVCNRNSYIVGGKIIIGEDTVIASDVTIISENHGINPNIEIPYKDQKITCKSISIGKGCWIGEKVIILPGVTIGDKSIIGAGSIVTKSIPENSIAVGNPARIIKKYNFVEECWELINNDK